MLEETIKAVQSAETQADQILKDASAQSIAIVDAAKKAAEQLKETRVQEAKAKAEAARKASEAETEKTLISVEAEIQKEIAALKKGAVGKEAQAIDEIIRQLF